MMIDFNELLKNLINSATILALLGFLGKKVIETYLDKRMEQHKQKLNQDIETVKNKLNMMATEHQIRYSKLHEERAEIIKQLYSSITLYESYLRSYIRVINDSEFHERSEDWKGGITKSLPAILKLYNYNKIYFNKMTCKTLDEFLIKAGDITRKVMELDSIEKFSNDPQIQNELQTIVEEWILPLKESLEQDFREQLGVK